MSSREMGELSGFKKYKKNKKNFKESDQYRKVFGMMSGKTGLWTKTRVKRALIGLGHNELAKSILECSKSQRCGQVYCKECRDRAAFAMTSRVKKHIAGRFGDGEYKDEQNITHLNGN